MRVRNMRVNREWRHNHHRCRSSRFFAQLVKRSAEALRNDKVVEGASRGMFRGVRS